MPIPVGSQLRKTLKPRLSSVPGLAGTGITRFGWGRIHRLLHLSSTATNQACQSTCHQFYCSQTEKKHCERIIDFPFKIRFWIRGEVGEGLRRFGACCGVWSRGHGYPAVECMEQLAVGLFQPTYQQAAPASGVGMAAPVSVLMAVVS